MNRFVPTLVPARQVTLDDWCLFGDEYRRVTEIAKHDQGAVTLAFANGSHPSAHAIVLVVDENQTLTIYTRLFV